MTDIQTVGPESEAFARVTAAPSSPNDVTADGRYSLNERTRAVLFLSFACTPGGIPKTAVFRRLHHDHQRPVRHIRC